MKPSDRALPTMFEALDSIPAQRGEREREREREREKEKKLARYLWIKPLILASWKSEIRRIRV
jgi:hypothetical protein